MWNGFFVEFCVGFYNIRVGGNYKGGYVIIRGYFVRNFSIVFRIGIKSSDLCNKGWNSWCFRNDRF